MNGKSLVILITVSMFVSVFFAGCGPETDLSLKFTADDTSTYKVSTETVQEVKFEQPSLNKSSLDQKVKAIDMTLLQKIESVDDSGAAIANVTLQSVKVYIKDKEGVKFDFDSQRQEDTAKPLAKLLGQSYRIKLLPDGNAKVVDAAAIRNTVKGGSPGKVAKSLLTDEKLIAMHKISSLPDVAKSTLSKGDSWVRTEPSHKLMLAPKTFEKIYILEDVKDADGKQLAYVQMNAASKPAGAGADAGSMGMFSNMFDSEEAYTGSLVLDIASGTIIENSEKLIATYLAQEPPRDQKSDKGPDTLVMSLTHSVSMEKID